MTDPIVTTHIAGLGLAIGNRFARQRCAWCGEPLVDEDATLMASTSPEPRDPCWPIDTLVRVTRGDGVTGFAVVQSDVLPEDCCAVRDTRQPPRLTIVKP